MKNKIFLILLSAFLFVGTNSVFANPENLENKGWNNNQEIQNIVYDEETKRQLIEEMNASVTTRPRTHNIDETVAKSPYQKTNSNVNAVPKLHNELFDVIFMFVKVMFAVVVASVLIYFLLIIVKKFFGDKFEENVPSWDDEPDLRTPKNDTSALRNFLNQTKNRQD